MAERLYLVDGNSSLFRAFYAIRGLTNDDGLPTNAVYGFTTQLLKLLRQEAPDYLAVVFDAEGPTFRHELYPQYKANRADTPEDLVPQLPYSRDVVRGMNIPVLEVPGYEADDVIATLASAARERDVDVVVVSTDKDLMQLVGGRCTLFDPMKDVRYGSEGVAEKTGVTPDQIIDWLALMGDSSDNIPGVPGIGKKTAATLLQQYGDLDGLYAHVGEIKGKRRENLETFRDQAYLSRDLATLAHDAPVDRELEPLRRREPDHRRLAELFGELGFRALQREFHQGAVREDAPQLGRAGFQLVRTWEELVWCGRALSEADRVSVDTICTGADPRRGALVGVALAADAERAWYVPVGHIGVTAGAQLPLPAALEVLRPLLEDADRPKAVHDVKVQSQVLALHGVTLRGATTDTMLASYLVDAGRHRHALTTIAVARLDHASIPLSDLTGTGRGRLDIALVPPDVLRDFMCERAQLIDVLSRRLDPELAEQGVATMLRDLELPLAAVLATMESAGVLVDAPRLNALSAELGARADMLEGRAHLLAGEAFNLGSPKQLREILFDKLGLTGSKKTQSGYSTDQGVLEELALHHDLPAVIVQWRQLTKLKGTYTDALPLLVNPATGRIHTSFNQAVAATGRLSSTDPNLQNIPIRTAEGVRIREAFVAPEGSLLLSADYSQIELRLLAHLCGDEAFRAAFREGVDIHRRTASEMFGVDENAVTRKQRGLAKTINFGIMYGMSAFRLAREQDMGRAEAQQVIDEYFARYPRILAWKEETLEAARADGYVSTLFGRIRKVPEIHARNRATQRGAERVAVNAPVQGSAADIIKMAMIRIAPRLATELPEARMLLQVHDELVFEVVEARVEALAALVTQEMERVVDLQVPLVVNAAWGKNWLEAH